MAWKFLYSKESEFILSDSPFILIDDGSQSDSIFEGSENYVVYIPLSRGLCVTFSRLYEKISHEIVTHEGVSEINNMTFLNAKRWLIGSSKKVLCDVVEYNKTL
mgnify:CR=1 FL=1